MVISIAGNYTDSFANGLAINKIFTWNNSLLLFMDAWVSMCMFFSWIIFRLARAGIPNIIISFLIMIVGYGPMLCTITLMAFFAEIRHSTIVWDKTEKQLKIHEKKVDNYHPVSFELALAKDIHAERKLIVDEFIIIMFMIFFFAATPAIYNKLS